MKENLESEKIKLDKEDVDAITGLNKNFRICPAAKYFFTLNQHLFE